MCLVGSSGSFLSVGVCSRRSCLVGWLFVIGPCGCDCFGVEAIPVLAVGNWVCVDRWPSVPRRHAG